MAPEEVTSPSIDAKVIKRVKAIVGALLFYRLAVDNKLLVELNSIGTQQAPATESANEAIDHLLDYLATSPNDGIIYIASNMVLDAHSDAELKNESKGRNRYGAQIFLAEEKLVPQWNGSILTIAQVINFVMSSAAEAGLGAIFITAK